MSSGHEVYNKASVRNDENRAIYVLLELQRIRRGFEISISLEKKASLSVLIQTGHTAYERRIRVFRATKNQDIAHLEFVQRR